MSLMRYDRRATTVAMKSDCSGAAVAQVPASATRSRQNPTSIAQSRGPLVAASQPIQTAHLAPMPSKKSSAGSVLTSVTGQLQLASTLERPANCRAQRGFSYSMCMLGRGSMPTDQSSQLLGMTFDWMKPGTMTVRDLIRPLWHPSACPDPH